MLLGISCASIAWFPFIIYGSRRLVHVFTVHILGKNVALSFQNFQIFIFTLKMVLSIFKQAFFLPNKNWFWTEKFLVNNIIIHNDRNAQVHAPKLKL